MSPDGGRISEMLSTEALAERMNSAGLRILDASWHMPAEQRNAREEYAAEHIPGACFFDIDQVCDHETSLPHMLPSEKAFSAAVSALGISNQDEIVVYDSAGLFSAARVWWMFRVMGHDRISVLNGGLPKWKAENRVLLSSQTPAMAPQVFRAKFQPGLLRTQQQVSANIAAAQELLLDARSPGRFLGTEPEPREGLERGHIEGSQNVPFKEVLSPPYNTLKPPEELRKLFMARGINPHQPVAVTCGSGVTACVLALALAELGNKTVAVYDGAWAEWGQKTAPALTKLK